MSSFTDAHAKEIQGELTMFDRAVFKGHLTRLFPDGAFGRFLGTQDVLLKDFASYVSEMTEELKRHTQKSAADAGRPYRYLEKTVSRARTGVSKEDLARDLSQADGITDGLICVLAAVEPCMSFNVVGNRATHRLEVVRRPRKCLHFYYYFMDAELGLCHVRIQSWFPFEVQIYVNGHEWLARQLDARGVGYRRYENALVAVDDLEMAARLCDRFAHRAWPRLLDALAARVNPHLKTIKAAGFGGYYWVMDQAEVATDVMFLTRPRLERIYPDLVVHATSTFGAEDVLRFLGRKLHGNLAKELETSTRRRPEGWRVKHRLARNSIKIYDKASVLRVEVTINNPSEFRVLRRVRADDGAVSLRWCPMNKGVANMWRYYQVGSQATHRYLDALGAVQPKGEAVAAIDGLCRSHVRDRRRHGRFQPFSSPDLDLFRAVLAGEHTIRGFSNRDIARRLYPGPPESDDERRRRCQRVSRLVAKLRGHGLVAKVPHRRLYRPTRHGLRVMGAVLEVHDHAFPRAYLDRSSVAS